MFRSVLNSIRFVGIGIAALLSAEPLAAQTAVCSLSDPNYQYCLYHGVGRQLGYEPSNTTELSATANWDQPNDGDLHGLLPQTETYSDPLIALPQYPLQPTQPFYPNATGSHIYPNQYQSQVNGGAAVATHSGDDGGGVATYAGQPGCDPATLTGVSCESIGITGEVPSGLYSFTLHAFPDTGTTFDPTNFDITVRATGNMVLTANSVATATPNSTSEVLIDPDTGVIRQVGTYQGTNNTTSRLDVYALNVGHAGHVGGVTIPQIGSYLDTQGVQRWFPANPQDVDVSLPDQIAMQFHQRDILVDQYQEEVRAELQRRYEAEQRRLARLREQYLEEQRRQERLKAQEEQPGLRLVYSPQNANIPSPVNPAYYDEWLQRPEYSWFEEDDRLLTGQGSLLNDGCESFPSNCGISNIDASFVINTDVGLRLYETEGQFLQIPGAKIGGGDFSLGLNELELESDEVELGIGVDTSIYGIKAETGDLAVIDGRRTTLDTGLNSSLFLGEANGKSSFEISRDGLELETSVDGGAYLSKTSIPVNFKQNIGLPLTDNQLLITASAEPYVAAGVGGQIGGEVDIAPTKIKIKGKIGLTFGPGAGIDPGLEAELITPNDSRYVR